MPVKCKHPRFLVNGSYYYYYSPFLKIYTTIHLYIHINKDFSLGPAPPPDSGGKNQNISYMTYILITTGCIILDLIEVNF